MSTIPARLDYNDIAMRKKAKEVARKVYPQLTEDVEIIDDGEFFSPSKIILPDGIERVHDEEFYTALSDAILSDKLFVLREQRNQYLAATDMYVVPDYPHKSEESKQAWLDYRKQLREITDQDLSKAVVTENFRVTNITWPTIPS